jgi:starch phosphorylase
MLQEYIERLYLPAAREFRRRSDAGAVAAVAMRDWESRLRRAWPRLHIGDPAVMQEANEWHFSAAIYLGDIGVDEVRVELFSEPQGDGPAVVIPMDQGIPIAGSVNAHIYAGRAPAGRPAADYTIRVIPSLAGVSVPAELPLILWQK